VWNSTATSGRVWGIRPTPDRPPYDLSYSPDGGGRNRTFDLEVVRTGQDPDGWW